MITGYLTLVSFDLTDGIERQTITEAARMLGLTVAVRSATQLDVYLNEAMDAYKLGNNVAIIRPRRKS